MMVAINKISPGGRLSGRAQVMLPNLVAVLLEKSKNFIQKFIEIVRLF